MNSDIMSYRSLICGIRRVHGSPSLTSTGETSQFGKQVEGCLNRRAPTGCAYLTTSRNRVIYRIVPRKLPIQIRVANRIFSEIIFSDSCDANNSAIVGTNNYHDSYSFHYIPIYLERIHLK